MYSRTEKPKQTTGGESVKLHMQLYYVDIVPLSLQVMQTFIRHLKFL